MKHDLLGSVDFLVEPVLEENLRDVLDSFPPSSDADISTSVKFPDFSLEE